MGGREKNKTKTGNKKKKTNEKRDAGTQTRNIQTLYKNS